MSLKLRNGIWQWRKTVDGHVSYKSTKTNDKKLAQQIAAQWEAEIVKEVVLAGTKPVSAVGIVGEYLEARAGTAGLKNAQMHLNKFADELGDKKLKELTDGEVLRVVDKERVKGRKLSTLSVMTNYWNSLMQFAEDRNYTPGPRIPTIKGVQGKIRYLTLEEEVALLGAIDPNKLYQGKSPSTDFEKQNNWDLTVALLDLGCRYSEAADMHWSQVNLQKGTILVKRGKKGKLSTLYITRRLKEVLERRLADSDSEFVFPTKQGRHNETHWMQKAVIRAGISTASGSVTLHTLRHTAANRWLQAGMSLPEVQQMLGHANIQTTMIYLHVNPTDTARKAADILDKLAAASA